MENSVWSVGLVIDDLEARRLSENSIALYIMEASEGHFLRFSTPPAADVGELESMRLEVSAATGLIAEERALGIVYRARRAAGLPDRVIPVAWVAPKGALEDGENYLDQAEDLLEGEQFGLAIVSAEIHLESQAKTMIEMAVNRHASQFREVLLQHSNNTKIQYSAARKMVERFLGIQLTRLPEWEEYKAHLGRRNEVVHSGKSFDEDQAKASIAVVRALWLQLAAAAKQVEKVGIEAFNGEELAALTPGAS